MNAVISMEAQFDALEKKIKEEGLGRKHNAKNAGFQSKVSVMVLVVHLSFYHSVSSILTFPPVDASIYQHLLQPLWMATQLLSQLWLFNLHES